MTIYILEWGLQRHETSSEQFVSHNIFLTLELATSMAKSYVTVPQIVVYNLATKQRVRTHLV